MPLSKTPLFFAILAILMLVFISPQAHAKTSDQDLENQINQTILLQGFPSDAEIHYTILSGQNIQSKGVGRTDPSGTLKVQAPLFTINDAEQRVYDFKISNNGNYVDVLLRHNLKTGKISASGKGLSEFSDIGIIAAGQNIRSKTDWSGAFYETNILGNSKQSDNNFEVALHGFSNLGGMAKNPNPAIIKVLSAPGGGLLTDTPNQPPSLSPPSSGTYPLSTGSAGPLAAASAEIVENYITAMMLITEQLTAVMMHQLPAIGRFFDAKIQLEAQRTHQQLTAEAVKDYHPSEQMCRVGSYVRSLASAEQKSQADKLALNDIIMERYTNQLFASSAINASNDLEARLKQFREVYCNPKDSNLGLLYLCEHDRDEDMANSDVGDPVPTGIGGIDTERINKDINYTKTVDFPQTFDVDLSDGITADDEQDIIAMAKHLYWPSLFEFGDNEALVEKSAGFLDARRVIALKNVAHTSYTNLVGLKSRSEPVPPGGGVEPGWTYMKTLMRNFGITDDEIETMVGVQPSYWAQMDILTKKMYQLPSFYTNLYDKPANVERMSVTLDAIELMQMRDQYDSLLRREMLNSALLETELVRGNHYNDVESRLLFLQK